MNDRLIPTGEIAPLKGSALDYSDWKALEDTAIDHNFVLPEDGKLRRAASLRLRATQLQLDVLTTQPALQVYTGDGLNSSFAPRSFVLKPRAFLTHLTSPISQVSRWSPAVPIGSARSISSKK